MNFFAKHIQGFGILLLTGFILSASGLYWDIPHRWQRTVAKPVAKAIYTCPMHPEVARLAAGDCPECGMKLILTSQLGSETAGCAKDHAGCCSKKEILSENPAQRESGCTRAATTVATQCPLPSAP